MSKRYSGKSFKDSSIKKKPKLSFKEKRKLRKEKQKNLISYKINKNSWQNSNHCKRSAWVLS